MSLSFFWERCCLVTAPSHKKGLLCACQSSKEEKDSVPARCSEGSVDSVPSLVKKVWLPAHRPTEVV